MKLNQSVTQLISAKESFTRAKSLTLDGIQSLEKEAIAAAMELAQDNSPGKFGVYFEDRHPTKNELEWQWVEEAQAAAPDLSGKDLLRKRFAAMR